MSYFAVIGAGSWGTSLANHLACKGHDVSLWANEKEVVDDIACNGINSLYLPGIALSDNIRVTDSLEAALKNTRFVLNVVPTQFARSVFNNAAEFIPEEYERTAVTAEDSGIALIAQYCEHPAPSMIGATATFTEGLDGIGQSASEQLYTTSAEDQERVIGLLHQWYTDTLVCRASSKESDPVGVHNIANYLHHCIGVTVDESIPKSFSNLSPTYKWGWVNRRPYNE